MAYCNNIEKCTLTGDDFNSKVWVKDWDEHIVFASRAIRGNIELDELFGSLSKPMVVEHSP